MKTFSKISTFSLILLSQTTIAQFISVPYSMHTPYGNVPMTNRVYMPSHYNGKSNPKFDFIITLKKNDSVVNLRSRILSQKKKLYVVWKQKKTKIRIYPNETEAAFRILQQMGQDGRNSGGQLLAFQGDNWRDQWLLFVAHDECIKHDCHTGRETR